MIKQDKDKILPKGIGMKFYEKNLILFDKLSKSRKERYLHRVYKHTGISVTPLSSERWNELFLPVLKKWGYQKAEMLGDKEIWTRLYDGRN